MPPGYTPNRPPPDHNDPVALADYEHYIAGPEEFDFAPRNRDALVIRVLRDKMRRAIDLQMITDDQIPPAVVPLDRMFQPNGSSPGEGIRSRTYSCG